MRAQFVNENMRFERGASNRGEVLDRILDRKITLEMEAANVSIDDKGIVRKGLGEDTDHFLDVLKRSGAEWRQLSDNWRYGGVPFEFRGTKEQLIPIITMWDAYGRSEEEVAEALEDWDGSEEDLWEIIA